MIKLLLSLSVYANVKKRDNSVCLRFIYAFGINK